MPLNHDELRAAYHAELTREWREMPAAVRERLPVDLRGGLDRYIIDRIRPGGFLQAVLRNDLADAALRATAGNAAALFDIFVVLHNYAPATCHGSPAKVERWLERSES